MTNIPIVNGTQFQLDQRTLAIEVIETERRAVSIPAGAIITILAANNDQTVDVLWDTRRVELFTCDVSIRGTEIKKRNAQA